MSDIYIMAFNIGNAYFNTECRENLFFSRTRAWRECCHTIVRALYGSKSSGVAWRELFSHFIQEDLKFIPTRYDPDV